MTSENEYRLVVDKAVEDAIDMPISNGRPEHAVYLMQKMLENASEVVRVFSGQLTREFEGVSAYGGDEILGAARAFLGRGGKMKVLLEKPIDVDRGQSWTDHPLVKMALSIVPHSSHFEVKQVLDRDLDELREAKALYHWITVDQRAYRLELDTRMARAIANFGNPRTAKALVVLFDDLFSKAIPLER